MAKDRYIGKAPNASASAQLDKPKRHNAKQGQPNNSNAKMAPVNTTGK